MVKFIELVIEKSKIRDEGGLPFEVKLDAGG
jgi:hypothetical protein